MRLKLLFSLFIKFKWLIKIGLSYTIVFLYLRLSVLHNIMFANLTKNMISSKFFFIKRFFRLFSVCYVLIFSCISLCSMQIPTRYLHETSELEVDEGLYVARLHLNYDVYHGRDKCRTDKNIGHG